MDHAERRRRVGRPRQVSDEDLIKAIKNAMHDTGAPFTTTFEVIDRVALLESGVQQRLDTLTDEGWIVSAAVAHGG